MSTVRFIALLAAVVGFLLWVSWFPSETEPKNKALEEIQGAASTQAGAERLYQGFRR